VSQLLADPAAYERMALASNPYGDGRAAERSVQSIGHLLGIAERPQEFGARDDLQ
jgi:UDP-N-acetylglucosamine 2-epimerase (non-hydrolysing)